MAECTHLLGPAACRSPAAAAQLLPLVYGELRKLVAARNQWASLVRYLDDSRFAINNGAGEQATRPLAGGRSNWLCVGGDGGLRTASVLLTVCASATRHRLHPLAYLRDVLHHPAVRSAGADLLPDAPAPACNRLASTPLPPDATGGAPDPSTRLTGGITDNSVRSEYGGVSRSPVDGPNRLHAR